MGKFFRGDSTKMSNYKFQAKCKKCEFINSFENTLKDTKVLINNNRKDYYKICKNCGSSVYMRTI